MSDDYSQFLGTDTDEDIPFDDLPPFTGTEWWRGGDALPPPNAQFVDGAVNPNTPYGTSFSADHSGSGAGTNYNASRRSPYGVIWGTEVADALLAAADDDPYAIGQSLGAMSDSATTPDWIDDTSQDAW